MSLICHVQQQSNTIPTTKVTHHHTKTHAHPCPPTHLKCLFLITVSQLNTPQETQYTIGSIVHEIRNKED